MARMGLGPRLSSTWWRRVWGFFVSLQCIALVALSATATAEDDEEGLPTVEETTEGYDVAEGLFTFYTDPDTGSMLMAVTSDQIGIEFIAFTYTENGVLEAGTFRGSYDDQRVIRFDRHFGALELSEVNTAFYFDPESPIARARDANISQAIIGSLSIIAETPGEADDDPVTYLIDADQLFKSEMLSQITPDAGGSNPFGFQPGAIAFDRTKYDRVRAYPENVDVRVDYVFSNPYPYLRGSAAVTDARSITLTVQHSILAMPEPGFQPRFDDYRVGYFFDQVTDLTSFEAAPYRDLINRWRLEKADPEAELSEPVKPITYWIENTTPYEFRDAIKEGVLAWNEAFEAAGFKNALRVEVQPDDAEWDAGDIRYNVLRWTSSPSPPFGGYGPSFTNPRTGEILGADIMLELSYLKTFALRSEAFDIAGLPASAVEPLGHDDDHQHHDHQNGKNDRRFHCAAGEEMRNKLGFSIAALAAAGADAEEQTEMVRQALVSLIMHEVGHTLGLQHNMKASSAFGHREIHDPEVTKGAPSSSVMDYHAVNIAPLGVPQGDYDHTRPGAYDIWAVVFGYSPDTDDSDFRAGLLAKSSDPHLAFGNDADAMASPYNGIDPRTMIFDQSSDPVAYAIDRIELIQSIFPRLLERYNGEGSYQKLLRQYFVLSGQMARMGAVISKQIGGVYVERSDPQNGDIAPYTPVPAAQQREAMQALADYIFAPDAFSISPDLMRRLQRQRRGFNFYFNTEDPKIHGRVAATQSMVLRQLMNPRTMQRLTDSALYGNRYSAAQMIQDLNDAVFGRDLAGRPNTFRRNLQIDYTERLVRMATSPAYDPVANAAAFAGLQDLKSRFGFVPEFLLSLETRAHRAAIRHELKALDG